MLTRILLLLISLCGCLVSGKVHASIKNRLGTGGNITLHCQSKDDDLGVVNVSYGDEFGWDFSVNAWGSTLFFCDIEWENVSQVPGLRQNQERYHLDAYSFPRDRVRCQTQCAWLISTEGIYGLNGRTGLWEYIYHWPF
ncbi:hypothetical protein UlMin_044114 [Ulmus minor]